MKWNKHAWTYHLKKSLHKLQEDQKLKKKFTPKIIFFFLKSRQSTIPCCPLGKPTKFYSFLFGKEWPGEEPLVTLIIVSGTSEREEIDSVENKRHRLRISPFFNFFCILIHILKTKWISNLLIVNIQVNLQFDATFLISRASGCGLSPPFY